MIAQVVCFILEPTSDQSFACQAIAGDAGGPPVPEILRSSSGTHIVDPQYEDP